MDRLRILFVTHTVMMGGANLSLLRLMLELRQTFQVEPVVLMPHIRDFNKKRNMQLACQKEGIECYSYRYYWFKERRRVVSYLRCLSNLVCYPRVSRKLKGQTFHLIHSNGSVLSLGAFLSRTMHLPHVWHLREFGDLDFGLHPLFGHAYERWVYGHADVFIAISEVVKKHYLQVVPEQKIVRIYNGVVPPAGLPRKKDPQPLVQFCLVGQLSLSKNQLEALRAADVLVNGWGVTQFHLTLIGYEEVEYAPGLRSFIEEHHLGQYVTMLGERNDVGELLGGMDVGLMLSTNEAFGRVTVEYMMQGLAVVVTDTGANPEIVEDGVTGLVYHLGDVEALASRMKQLIGDRQLIRDFSERGRARALQAFTSQQNTRQVYAVYQSLVK